jgi:cupin 2 domain-containing protein
MASLGPNLFANLPVTMPEELCQTLLEVSSVRIERIVSTGQASPADFWYDQQENEWVVVLQGEAKLLFAGDQEPIHLRSGDTVNIPAHCKHRVVWTVPERPTVWLAVFY